MHKENLDHITDQELLDRFYEDHDNHWLGILLQRYVLLLFGVCMKYLKNEEEARDSVQQIFLKAITELHKYRVSFFSSWIYKVTRNHCLMKIRASQGRVSLPVPDKLALATEEAGEDQHQEKEQMLQLMTLSIAELNEEQKRCVTLFYLEKKSYQEIAEHTGFSMMQVKSYIQNGKRNLKILVDKKMNKVP